MSDDGAVLQKKDILGKSSLWWLNIDWSNERDRENFFHIDAKDFFLDSMLTIFKTDIG